MMRTLVYVAVAAVTFCSLAVGITVLSGDPESDGGESSSASAVLDGALTIAYSSSTVSTFAVP